MTSWSKIVEEEGLEEELRVDLSKTSQEIWKSLSGQAKRKEIKALLEVNGSQVNLPDNLPRVAISSPGEDGWLLIKRKPSTAGHIKEIMRGIGKGRYRNPRFFTVGRRNEKLVENRS